MDNNTVRKYVLEGLDCAGCAGKIEERINKLEYVKHATFDFVNKLLTIEHININKIDIVKEEAKEIIQKLEPHVKIVDKQSSKTYVYKFEGLGCSSCGQKMEDRIHNMDGISEANVDFANARLIIRPVSGVRVSELISKIEEIIESIEPGTRIITDDKVKINKSPLNGIDKKFLFRIGLGIIFFVAAILGDFVQNLEITLFVIAYILIGGDVALKAIKNIIRGQVFDENFLMTLATVGAFAIKEYPEAVAVMLFYQVGELFQSMAVNKSRKSIGELLNIRPDYANLLIGDETNKVSPEEVAVGETILVKAGERVPLDGTILDGKSFLDTSALTGESVPREVGVGDTVLSGFINNNGLLKIKVNKTFGESTVSKILDLVQNASSRKAPTERFITKFARGYTPIVVISAVFIATLPPLLIEGAVFTDWIYRALIFLVVSCPCALVVSIPLGFFGGIGGASKHGILIKGSNYLEALNQVNIVVLDKTGTLTKGTFKVTKIENVNKAYSKDQLVEYAAYAEHYSNHPIAKSIVKEYKGNVEPKEIESHEEVSGKGVIAKYKGLTIAAGNNRMMDELKIEYSETNGIGTIVHISINNLYAGYIMISDEIKEDSKEAIKRLREKGVKKIVMLTGDHELVAKSVADELGLDQYYAELLPHEKVEKLEQLDKENTTKGKLVFVGDGVNDAPVLARADIGIAMGALGSDAAIEAADIVLMTDETSKIADSLVIAKKTREIVWQNVVFALGVKGIVLIMGVMGMASMWLAVFADVGVALLAVLNAMRVLKIRID